MSVDLKTSIIEVGKDLDVLRAQYQQQLKDELQWCLDLSRPGDYEVKTVFLTDRHTIPYIQGVSYRDLRKDGDYQHCQVDILDNLVAEEDYTPRQLAKFIVDEG